MLKYVISRVFVFASRWPTIARSTLPGKVYFLKVRSYIFLKPWYAVSQLDFVQFIVSHVYVLVAISNSVLCILLCDRVLHAADLHVG